MVLSSAANLLDSGHHLSHNTSKTLSHALHTFPDRLDALVVVLPRFHASRLGQ